MLDNRLSDLFRRLSAREITPSEKEELRSLMARPENENQVNELIQDAWEIFSPGLPPFDAESSQEIWENIAFRIRKHNPVRKIVWLRTAAAVLILISVSIGVFYFVKRTDFPQQATTSIKDIPPGGDKAILILSNGQRIPLNGEKGGNVAIQGTTVINNSAKGVIAYLQKGTRSGIEKTVGFNTIQTPQGGQYQVILPDSTRVWLNASSSLRYPVEFNGKSRDVTLEGEAYFEVMKDRLKPFSVHSKDQTVQVLGTHFNVKAYDDEPALMTTLLEGSVEISSQNIGIRKLLPGQQSVVDVRSKKLIVQTADTDAAIAWKNGLFMFDHESLDVIMRKIGRWYNVEVVYQDNDTRKYIFEGSVSRFTNVSEILHMLQVTGNANFKMEGNKIFITKK